MKLIEYSRKGEIAYLNPNMIVDIYVASDEATFAVLVNGEIAMIEQSITEVKKLIENEEN